MTFSALQTKLHFDEFGKIKISNHPIPCHGRVVRSTGFKLWCLLCRVWVRILVVTLAIRKIGEVVLSALPSRLRIDDAEAYICMDCKRVTLFKP